MNPEIANYIGYAASLFIVLSFVLKDIKKIRFINLLGCICFVVFGFFSVPDSYIWPIIIPNAILCFIQIYHLVKNK
ncbi:hypothetical protein [Kaistella palustris]|uniref:hypothetical protein n=1 Tax=Kaistella palustris TaxID=493376 RepID=UPI00040C138F|nr:hypothetical protein [Kaistella palustris]